MLKKLLTGAVCAGLILTLGTAALHAEEAGVSVYVDNSKVKFEDQQPVIQEGRTLVPLRAVFEKAGAQVSWDQDTQTATLQKDAYTVTLKLYEAFLYKNGKPVALDVPSTMVNDRLLIPVRAIGEAMDFGVTWDGMHSGVLIATDGKAYRANGQWETGFRDMRDAGFYLSAAINDLQEDLNGDGTMEKISFKPQKETENATLFINETDYTSLIPQGASNVKALAVVDVVGNDKYKELILIDKDDTSSAFFFRFNGLDLIPLTSKASLDGAVPFLDKLFFDGVENIISDFDGICFTDLMVCPGLYSLEDTSINRYSLDMKNIVGRNLYRTYNDEMAYWIKYTNSYDKGSYVSEPKKADYSIHGTDLPQSFKILDFYVDETNPSRFEFYVQYASGEKAVIWPYAA